MDDAHQLNYSEATKKYLHPDKSAIQKRSESHRRSVRTAIHRVKERKRNAKPSSEMYYPADGVAQSSVFVFVPEALSQ